MKQIEIEVKVGVLRKELAHWEAIQKGKSCGQCWNFQKGVCTLAGIAPPPDVQATGCPEYDYDDIPF